MRRTRRHNHQEADRTELVIILPAHMPQSFTAVSWLIESLFQRLKGIDLALLPTPTGVIGYSSFLLALIGLVTEETFGGFFAVHLERFILIFTCKLFMHP
jgi:hypothetical protein